MFNNLYSDRFIQFLVICPFYITVPGRRSRAGGVRPVLQFDKIGSGTPWAIFVAPALNTKFGLNIQPRNERTFRRMVNRLLGKQIRHRFTYSILIERIKSTSIFHGHSPRRCRSFLL